MSILHYTQHVLGIGHLFRSLAIDRALAPATVHLTTGGPAVTLSLPPNVRHHPMPALKMDSQFTAVQTVDREADLETTWQEREKLLLELYHQVKPDVILVEMFPFGRKRFARELLPLLDANRANRGRANQAKVLCSLRDILVEKNDQESFEKKVLKWLNPYFDGVLVHSDPALIKLDQTFSRVQDIICPVWYTGYVAEGPSVADKAAARKELGLDTQSPIILVSAGSGTVGEELLLAALEASILLQATLPHRLMMFTGPHAGVDLRSRLCDRSRGHDHIVINDFTPRFADHVLACDLSVSMAGYNTTMNLLACGTPGLMYPFDQNREQRMRLTALAKAGYLAILETEDLVPAKLARILENGLRTSPQSAKNLRLQGDEESAAIIFRLVGEELSQ
jgi:predicted glycosyltransferase